MANVGAVILAAGASTRLGQPKQLLPYRGVPLVRHAAQVALQSTCRPVVLVVGAHAEALRPVVADLPLTIVENAQWERGPGSSIHAGIAALIGAGEARPLDAALVLLCDQPRITPAHIDLLVETYAKTKKPIVASEYEGAAGVPALFDRSLFSELAALDAARGAKALIMRDASRLALVPFPDAAIDIDTPADYETLCRLEL